MHLPLKKETIKISINLQASNFWIYKISFYNACDFDLHIIYNFAPAVITLQYLNVFALSEEIHQKE